MSQCGCRKQAVYGARLFLAGNYQEENNAIGIIDLASGAFRETTVAYQPYGFAVNATTGRVYVEDQAANEVAVIDASTRAVVNRFPIQEGSAFGDDSIMAPIGVSATRDRFYVTHLESQPIPAVFTWRATRRCCRCRSS